VSLILQNKFMQLTFNAMQRLGVVAEACSLDPAYIRSFCVIVDEQVS
jgi:hypothetical protein